MGAHFLAGVAGALFSPGRGLPVYCLFLLFAAALGIGAWLEAEAGRPVLAGFRRRRILRGSSRPDRFGAGMWGGACWGPRLLTEMMPFLVLLIVPSFDAVMTSRWQRRMFLPLQFVGSFCYPNGRWGSAPAGTKFA